MLMIHRLCTRGLCPLHAPCSEKLVKAFNDQTQRQFVFLLSSKAGGCVCHAEVVQATMPE
jgi:hypothetical protein